MKKLIFCSGFVLSMLVVEAQKADTATRKKIHRPVRHSVSVKDTSRSADSLHRAHMPHQRPQRPFTDLINNTGK
jgi:hypothetical protein